MASKVRFVLCSLLLSSALPVPLRSQGATLPAVMSGVEGGSSTNVPFGSSLACRYQCLYDVGVLPWIGPRLISGIRIRADNGTPHVAGNAIAAKGYLVVSVLMSTTATSAVTASATFEDNYGIDMRWVLFNHHLLLPAQPDPQGVTGPRTTNIDLPFTTPWWYGLVPVQHHAPKPANLLFEIWIHSQPTGSYPIDNLGSCVAATTDFGQQGGACAMPGSPPPTLSSDISMIAGSSFAWRVANGPPSAPLVIAFSLTDQGFLFGDPQYPLPYPMFDPLQPALPSAAFVALGWPWAAPDCWINLDTAVTLFTTCGASGTATVATPLPAGSHNVGLEIFAQAFLYSQTANPMQVITTRGRSSTICGPLDVARVFAFYDGTNSPPPPDNGAVNYGMSMVIEVL